MEFLSRIGDVLGAIFGGIGNFFSRIITKIFGSSNERYINKLRPKVEAIGALEPKMMALTDDELRGLTEKFRERLRHGETLDDVLVEAFAAVREAGRRLLAMRHYDVQLIGGMVLHSGAIAEMVTGEGKTLVATLPAYLNALEGKGVHVITVNDYLARRDMEWMGPLYMGLGLTVAAIYADMPADERQRAYQCDITYGTNNEFGFDYLRDNMKPAAMGDDRFQKRFQQVQRRNFAIIDEVDNILIDEARTPLIISGPAHDDITKYQKADRVARGLKKDIHFEIKEKEHTCHLTDEGVREAEKLAGVESFYTAGNMEWPHLIDNSLKAHHLYKRDVRYVVQGDEVVIVDEFTGRLMPGRHWSDGLHQAVEAKEGVKIKEENQTLATITLQNFFKLYNKLAGMTGTAMTEANEFYKIYKLDVIAIPTNRGLQRKNYADTIYLTEKEKFNAIAEEIERIHKWDVVVTDGGKTEIFGEVKRETEDAVEFLPQGERKPRTIPKAEIVDMDRKGRPVLVGTVSIEKSERLSDLLNRRGVKHEVLNAKHHKREAEIVAQAGRKGAVTIATNMAGRGTDIILGGNPETMAWAQLQEKYSSRLDIPREEWDSLVEEIETRENMKVEGQEVLGLGGLHIIGTERHEARRIDNQLRGRSGRQGDPGSSRFFLSLEDDLMRIFAGDWVKSVLTRLGMKEGEAIESRMVSRRIEGAQKRVEEKNFDIRKNLLEYDEVMDEQRKRVYGYRQRILDGVNCKTLILEMIQEQIDDHLDEFLAADYGPATFAKWMESQLRVEGLQAADFRDSDFESAERLAKDEAIRLSETAIRDAADENLPLSEDPDEWNWQAMATFVNTRWGLSFNERGIKKIGRDNLEDELSELVSEAIEKIDCSEGARYLDRDYAVRTALSWLSYKFNMDIPLEEVKDLEPAEFKQLVMQKASQAYTEKEAEFPVMAGISHFTQRDASGAAKGYDREGIAAWAKQRFDIDLAEETKQRDDVVAMLVDSSKEDQKRTDAVVAEAKAQVNRVFGANGQAAGNGALDSLSQWIEEKTGAKTSAEVLADLDREELSERVISTVEDRFRPEIRRMERRLVLEVLDNAWKEHLLAMDYLRSSVGLRGYGQVDPKVEYKKEGMRQFDNMWQSIGEQVTDLIFRMEKIDEGFVSQTWSGGEARHDQAASTSDIAQQQQAAIDASGASERKPEPIRNMGTKVGRNDPCPCGSGKKFKQCCGRPGRTA